MTALDGRRKDFAIANIAEEGSSESSRATCKTAFLAGLWTGAVVVLFEPVELYLNNGIARSIAYAIISFFACAPAYRYAFVGIADGSEPTGEGFSEHLRFLMSNAKLGLMFILGAGLSNFAVTFVGDLVG